MACNSRAKMNDSVRKLSKFQHAPLRPWVWLFFVYRICLFLKSTSLNLQLIFLFPENSPPALPISWSLPFNIVASCSALSMHSTRSMAVAVVRRCLQLWTWRCMIGPSHWTVYWCVPFVRFVFRNSFVFLFSQSFWNFNWLRWSFLSFQQLGWAISIAMVARSCHHWLYVKSSVQWPAHWG